MNTVTFDFTAISSVSERTLFRKLRWKIMPIIFAIFVVSFLDRVNIGYANLQLKPALSMTDAQFGWAAGVFSIAYLIFEFPVTLLFPKLGARKTFLRIAVLWGLTSALTMLVTTPVQLYFMRFALGAFEAGCLPAVVLHLNNWFPQSQRGRVTGIFMLATGIASMIGGPLSGGIMSGLNGSHGLAGWQWLFLLEGLPAVVLGILAWLVLVDHPESAEWLSAEEKAQLASLLNRERLTARESGSDWQMAAKDWRVWLLAFLLFAVTCGGYAVSFWLPSIIRRLGVESTLNVGLLALIPTTAGCFGFIFGGFSSDYFKDRRYHYVIGSLLSGIGFCSAFVGAQSLGLSLMLLSIANFALSASISVFWSIPPGYFTRNAAPAGVAFVNVGNVLAGLLSPLIIGTLSTATGSLYPGLGAIGVDLIFAAALMLLLMPRHVTELPAMRTPV